MINLNKKNSAVLIFCEWEPPLTGGSPSQMASDAESAAKSWRHNALSLTASQ